MAVTNPFLDPAAPSLASVVAALDGVEPDPRRRGEMRSALNTLARVLGRHLAELPADTALLGRLIRKAMPAAANVSPARWANVKSLVLGALKLPGWRSCRADGCIRSTPPGQPSMPPCPAVMSGPCCRG